MSLQLWKKKMAIIAAMNKGYLLDVSGNPAVLTAALKKPLQGVTVYGASGGVGDETVNLFDTANILKRLVRNSNDSISITDSNSITVEKTRDNVQERPVIIIPSPGTNMNITLSSSGSTVNLLGMYPFDTLYDSVSALEAVYGNTISIYSKTINTGQSPYIGIRIGNISQATTGTWAITNIKIKEGNDPDGYKIPVLMGEQVGSGYTRLEYIESTGTQYIDTGVQAKDSLRIEVDFEGGTFNFGSYQHPRTFWVQQAVSPPQYGFAWGNGGADNVSYSITYERHLIEMSKNGFDLDGVRAYTPTNHYFASGTATMYMFARLGVSGINYSKHKIYSCKIYDGNTLIRNFIPVKRNSDNIVGMYDAVNNGFYSNGNTSGDNFIAGAEIANKTINLYTPQQLTAAADTFAADIAAQTATLTAGGVSTDVSALQDWDQDFELTKGDNTVSIGTTVQPSAVEWRYLSSSRG